MNAEAALGYGCSRACPVVLFFWDANIERQVSGSVTRKIRRRIAIVLFSRRQALDLLASHNRTHLFQKILFNTAGGRQLVLSLGHFLAELWLSPPRWNAKRSGSRNDNAPTGRRRQGRGLLHLVGNSHDGWWLGATLVAGVESPSGKREISELMRRLHDDPLLLMVLLLFFFFFLRVNTIYLG